MQLLEPSSTRERKTTYRSEALSHRTIPILQRRLLLIQIQSCLTRPEVFSIFTDVRAENEKILLLKPFNHVAKSTRVDDFGKLQRDATDAVAAKLKKEWPRVVTTCLRQHLRHVTKGADSASNLNFGKMVSPRRLVQPRGGSHVTRYIQEVEAETVPQVPQPDDGGPVTRRLKNGGVIMIT